MKITVDNLRICFRDELILESKSKTGFLKKFSHLTQLAKDPEKMNTVLGQLYMEMETDQSSEKSD